jgi:hypothetical protein
MGNGLERVMFFIKKAMRGSFAKWGLFHKIGDITVLYDYSNLYSVIKTVLINENNMVASGFKLSVEGRHRLIIDWNIKDGRHWTQDHWKMGWDFE